MRHMTISLALLLLAPLAGLSAQETPPLLLGMRVRVTTLELRRIGQAPQTFTEIRRTGTLIALKSDTLVLREKENTVQRTIPLAHVKRLDLSQGRASHGKGALKGAAIGFLAGGGATGGAVLGVAETFGELTGAFLLGAIPGALVGSGIGALAGGERWEQVPLPVQVDVSP